MTIKTGRMKPCIDCGTEFWCTPCHDVGGPFREKKYCSTPCYRKNQKMSPEQALALFWSRVNKDAPNGCWEYTAGRDKWGYGDLQYMATPSLRKHIQAHRYSWMLLRGDPGKMDVLHKCNNPPCCNPDHLYLGTDLENARDRVNSGRYPHGVSQWSAKLSNAQVLQIRAEYRCERSGNRAISSNAIELAARYGVSKGTIVAAAMKRRWKHVV